MKSTQISDEWLYYHMSLLEEKLINALPEESEIEYSFSERFQNKMKKLLKRVALKEKYKISVTTARRTIASIVIVMSGIFMASLGVEAVRTEIYEFIQQRFEIFTRTEYQIVKNEPLEFVPMYPKYIPEGYKVDIKDVDDGFVFFRYINDYGKEFTVLQEQITDGLVIYEDCEYESSKETKIMGINAVCSQKEDGTIRVRWQTKNCIFQVSADSLTETEVIKICNSLME